MNGTLAELMGMQEAAHGPQQVSFDDPEQVLLWRLTQQFQLSPEEIQELQLAAPDPGMTLRQRVERLRPRTNMGGIEWGVDGSVSEPRLTGRVTW